jgi:hypothetical protein
MKLNKMAPSDLKRLARRPDIPFDPDKIYDTPEKNPYETKRDLTKQTYLVDKEIRERQRRDNAKKGIYPAYVDLYALIKIIPKFLSLDATAVSIFRLYESTSNQVNDWARRAVRRAPNKSTLTTVIELLLEQKSPELLLMQKYEVLQITSITQAVSYSAALKQMKLQLALAKRLEQKDNELHNKDKIITNYEKEIVLLKASLAAGHGNDKRQNALNLKKLNPCMSKTAIAKAVGLGRTTVSNLFNQPENKLVDGCT